MNNPLLENLNKQQLLAVTLPNISTLILAGAGSGKTRVLTTRIAWILQNNNVNPYNILAVTFTNKAANEMKTRISNMLPNININHIYIGTFHSIANRILKEHYVQAKINRYFQIIDRQEQLSLIKKIITENKLENYLTAKNSLKFIEYNKQNAQRSKNCNIGNNKLNEFLIFVYQKYEEICENQNLIDFDELLLKTLELLKHNEIIRTYYQNKFSHILVDEFQDTNNIQYEWIKAISSEQSCIFAVGDDDQSIYSFRGANSNNMNLLIKDFNIESIIKLEFNYRSTDNILQAANHIITNNKKRLGKNLIATSNQGELIKFHHAYSDVEEANFIINEIKRLHHNEKIKYANIAILYRNNFQSRLLEQKLYTEKIPYIIYGGHKFYERAEIKHILAYLRLLINPHDDHSLMRIINFPPRGLGIKTLEEIQIKATENQISLWKTINEYFYHKPKLKQFIELILDLQEFSKNSPLSKIVSYSIEKTNIKNYYQNTKDDNQNKIDNLKELVSATNLFENIPSDDPSINELTFHQQILYEFLNNAILISKDDNNTNNDNVQLMTIHSSKGLEFQVVFISGLEQGLFPSQQNITEGNLEEERRLMYVAITRAKQKLYLSLAETRMINGNHHSSVPSMFVNEIPSNLISGFIKRNNVFKDYYIKKQQNNNQNINIYFGYKIGDNVEHCKFGVGVIIDAQNKTNSANLTINFGKFGIKELDSKIANLKILK